MQTSVDAPRLRSGSDNYLSCATVLGEVCEQQRAAMLRLGNRRAWRHAGGATAEVHLIVTFENLTLKAKMKASHTE